MNQENDYKYKRKHVPFKDFVFCFCFFWNKQTNKKCFIYFLGFGDICVCVCEPKQFLLCMQIFSFQFYGSQKKAWKDLFFFWRWYWQQNETKRKTKKTNKLWETDVTIITTHTHIFISKDENENKTKTMIINNGNGTILQW